MVLRSLTTDGRKARMSAQISWERAATDRACLQRQEPLGQYIQKWPASNSHQQAVSKVSFTLSCNTVQMDSVETASMGNSSQSVWTKNPQDHRELQLGVRNNHVHTGLNDWCPKGGKEKLNASISSALFLLPKAITRKGWEKEKKKKSHTVMVWTPAHLQNQKLLSLSDGITKSTFKDGQNIALKKVRFPANFSQKTWETFFPQAKSNSKDIWHIAASTGWKDRQVKGEATKLKGSIWEFHGRSQNSKNCTAPTGRTTIFLQFGAAIKS